MKKPRYQVIITTLAWILTGFLALGTFLDAIGNAVNLITPPVTYIGTLILALVWISVQIILKISPVFWQTKDGATIRITKLGVGYNLPFFGMILLLWLPLFIGQDNSSQVLAQSTSNYSDVEQRLASNAFKAGYSFSQINYEASTLQDFQIWKNRTIAHLDGLDISSDALQDATMDNQLSLDETILIRDQLRANIEALHGVNVAATFVVGADLVPATRAFESYLTDEAYRQKLLENNISIMEFGFSINANIDYALFPVELKEDWVSIYSSTFVGDGSPEALERIKKFRENIVAYFYE